ncbi:NADH-dependent fumarate reductase, putative, partial [Trypanosoma cruzi]
MRVRTNISLLNNVLASAFKEVLRVHAMELGELRGGGVSQREAYQHNKNSNKEEGPVRKRG